MSTQADVERSPYVLPPMPRDFVVTGAGIVAEVSELALPTPDEWLDGHIRHFSPSSLRMLKVCPEQYRQRYILHKKERPGEALTLGSAMHSALAFNLEQKIESHEDRKVKEVIEYFHDEAWPKAIEADGGKEEIRWDDPTDLDTPRRDGERMTMAYHASVSPRIQPISKPEQKITLHVEGVPVPIIGYVDVEEAANVIDLKTGKQVQKKPDSNWRLQGTIYSLATNKPTHFHSLSRAKTPSIATPLTDPEMALPWREDIGAVTRTVLIDFAGQVEYFMHRYGPDETWPTSGVFMDYKGGAACRYCGFRKYCAAWAWEREVTVP